MRAWRLVFVLLALSACGKRNNDVCCTTVEDCAQIGVPADQLANYNRCDDGLSCVDNMCGAPLPPDAPNPDAAVDAPSSTGRCDPTKDFDTVTNLPNVHVAYGERHFVLSSNELTAYVLRDNQDVFEVSTSIRSSVADDFPVDTPDPLLPTASHASELFPSRQEHLLYFHVRTVPMYPVAQRDTNADAFADVGGIGINGTGDALTSATLAGVSADASRLYYTATGSLFQLTSSGSYFDFGVPMNISSMMVNAVAISPDELTLYYTTNPATGVFVTSRANKTSTFGPGSQLAVLATNDLPQSITADGCVLYIIGNHASTDGVFAVTKPH